MRVVTGHLGRAACALALTVGFGGCWAQPGFDARRTAYNPLNGSTTAANAADLGEAWRISRPGQLRAPLVIGNHTIFTYANVVEAVNTDTGVVQWSSTIQTTFPPTPAVTFSIGEPVLLPDGDVHVRWSALPYFGEVAVDLETGGQTTVPTQSFGGSPAVDGFRTARISSSLEPPNIVVWVEYGDFEGLVYSGSLSLAPTVHGPMILGDRVYATRDNQIVGFDFGSCTPVPPPGPADFCQPAAIGAASEMVSMPVAIGDHEIALNLENNARVFDAQTLQFKYVAPGGSVAGVPVAAGRGHVYAPGGDNLKVWPSPCVFPCLSPSFFSVGGTIATQPAIGNDVVYVGTTTGILLAFAADGCGTGTCAPLWNVDASPGWDSGIAAGPVVAGGRIAVALANGDLVMYERA